MVYISMLATETNGQTRADGIYRASMASRGKNGDCRNGDALEDYTP